MSRCATLCAQTQMYLTRHDMAHRLDLVQNQHGVHSSSQVDISLGIVLEDFQELAGNRHSDALDKAVVLLLACVLGISKLDCIHSEALPRQHLFKLVLLHLESVR